MNASSLPLLRPRTMGELLDQAIRLYRLNFVKFLGIMAIIEIPLMLIQLIVSVLTLGSSMTAVLDPESMTEEALPGMLGQVFAGLGASAVVGLASFVLIQGVATAALTRAIADNFLGEETGIEAAYSKIGRVWGSLLGALLFVVLLSIVLTIWLIVPCIGWFTGIGMLFFLWLAMMPLLAPVVVLERRGALDAIGRVWDLSRQRFWWLVIFVVVLFFFNLLVVSGPVAIINTVFQSLLLNSFSTGNPQILLLVQTITQALAGLLLGLLYHPLQSACITLAYFDLRVRFEGFDLALMTSQPGEAVNSAADIALRAPVARPGKLITWGDMGNFALLSILSMVVYAIPVAIIGLIGGLITGFATGM